MASASRGLVRALERCRRRARLASHRAEGRQWTTDGQPRLHNARFCEVAGRSLASSLCGRTPLRALRVRKTGVMQSVCPGRHVWATKTVGPLPHSLFCGPPAPRGVRASQFGQALRAAFYSAGFARVCCVGPRPPVPSAPQGGSPGQCRSVAFSCVSGPQPGRRALRARRPGTPGVRSHVPANHPQMIRKTSARHPKTTLQSTETIMLIF